jgi:hypothetical protein
MMRRYFPLFLAIAFVAAGCTLSPDEKTAREKSLKQNADRFIGSVISNDFTSAYNLSTKRLDSPKALEDHMKQPWTAGPVLMMGTVASMSWVNDKAAKVKVVWTFQQGSQQSYSAETLLWVWKGGDWKYDGRTLR